MIFQYLTSSSYNISIKRHHNIENNVAYRFDPLFMKYGVGLIF